MKKQMVFLLTVILLLSCLVLPAQKNLTPTLQRVKRAEAADFEGRGFNLTQPDADADNIYCGIINPVLEKYQPLPQKELSIWKYVEEPGFVSISKIHGFKYPENENFIPLNFSKTNSETILYAMLGNKLLKVKFKKGVSQKRELAVLDNDIRVIKAEVLEDKILLVYITEGRSRTWTLAEYDIRTKAFSQKVLKSVPCAVIDLTLPVFTKDGIYFVNTDKNKKTSVITRTDRQGNVIGTSQELHLTSPILVQGVEGLITCGGQYSKYDCFYVYILNSEMKVVQNFELISNSYDDENVSAKYINQLTNTKEAFLVQRTVFQKDGDYTTYISKGSRGGRSGGGGQYKSWGIGLHPVAENNFVSLGISMHPLGVVRPNCIIRYYH